MKKLGYMLLIVGITIISFYYINKITLENKSKNDADNYIINTSFKDDETKDTNKNKKLEGSTSENSDNINYTAVIEIPSINLKRGVVNSTNGFRSINYAISVDKISNYPDENGNFILYAHSGNSRISYFKNLMKVSNNDDIDVYYNGIKYHYMVINKYNIDKTGKAKVKECNDNKCITLITCNPYNKDKQIVVFGKIVNQLNY